MRETEHCKHPGIPLPGVLFVLKYRFRVEPHLTIPGQHGYASLLQLSVVSRRAVQRDKRAGGHQSEIVSRRVHFALSVNERGEKQFRFGDLLLAYPVVQLVATQQIAAEGKHSRAAQELLGEVLRESDISGRKERLEEEYRDVYNALSRAFNREQPLLLEYGPDLDDQGNVVFLNENKSRPVELLEILSDSIDKHKPLS